MCGTICWTIDSTSRSTGTGTTPSVGCATRCVASIPGDFPVSTSARNPYPGLRAFDDTTARYFLGRGGEARRLAELLRSGAADSRFVLVVGPSGCGKSSLVRAGVVPLLRADPGWLVVRTVTPGLDPSRSLATALTETGRQAGLAWEIDEVVASLRRPDGLRDRIDQLGLAPTSPSNTTDTTDTTDTSNPTDTTNTSNPADTYSPAHPADPNTGPTRRT